jgi:hypothetical protein
MIGTQIRITNELAQAVGKLAEKYPESSVEILYDDDRAEQLWEVTFELLEVDDVRRQTYIIDDETGEVIEVVSA